MAAGLAVVAAALAAAAPRGERGDSTRAGPPAVAGGSPDASTPPRSPAREGHGWNAHRNATVLAPVRIADADTVRLLHPGDRIDVIASTDGSVHARVVAGKVRVAQVPKTGDTVSGDGALVVLSVPRGTAAALAGAAAATRLAVTLC